MNSTTNQNEKNSYYFLEREEQAVRDYLTASDPETKQRIYNEILKPAFDIMIESIIRRYKLFIPDEDFENTFRDTSSFLLTKMEKFNPDINKKAYSYYGTITKNYLLGRITKYNKSLERNPSFEAMEETLVNDINYSTNGEDEEELPVTILHSITERIKKMLEKPENYSLKKNEIKVGNAIVKLFENWDYVLTTDGSNKLNKSAVLLFLKDATNMDAKGIREAMRKYKKEYLITKNYIIENEDIREDLLR